MAGIVLIIVGAIALTTFQELQALISPNAFYGLICLGVLIFLFAIVGFIVACYEIKAIEICYAFFTFCFAAALIGGGMAVMSLGGTIQDMARPRHFRRRLSGGAVHRMATGPGSSFSRSALQFFF